MRKMSKRFLGLLLSMIMVLSMGISVFAADQDTISVTVSISAVDATADVNDNLTVGDTYTGYTVVENVTPGTDVETIVRAALSQIVLSSVNSTLNVKEGIWVVAPDWIDPSITYNALNGLTMQDGTSKFIGIDLEDDDYWYGYGWTYSGYDGDTPLDINNYMSQNTISEDESSVDLLFDYYEYSKN